MDVDSNIETNSELKGYLDTVLKVSTEKFKYERKLDASRLGWGRLIVQCVKVYGELIKTEEMEALRHDVEELKELVNSKVIVA